MIHELLMCLLGNTGGIYQFLTENNKTRIKLVENLEFIHPAEVEICNKLAELGNFYKQICDFHDQYSFGKSFKDKPLKPGYYLFAFCNGLNLVVLQPYRVKISELEMEFLKDHYHNVTFLQSHLEHHYTLFTYICSLIDEITCKKLHGCQIVDMVYKYSISGDKTVKDTFEKILTVSHEVLFKQLRDWLIFGCLNDKYDEFFLYLDPKHSDLTETISDKNTIENASTLNEAEEIIFDGKFSSKFSQFSLNSAQLPSYISLKIANKILFTGELLQLFKSKSIDEIYSDDKNCTQFSQNLSVNKIHLIKEKNKSLQQESNIMSSKMEVFSKKIWSISQSQFSIIVFESFINEIRDYISEEMWSIIVEKYNLLGEFQKLKDMFLMGRGELFATFLDTAKDLLNKPIDQNFEYNINYYFQKSLSRMLLDEQDWPTKFKVISFEPINSKKNESTGWNRIGLSYRVEWPFHTFLTAKVLKKYNETFNYLLMIRRVQMQLNQCFKLQMRLGNKPNSINPKIWITRNHMSFLIDNFQFYLQADVLETQFEELQNKIKNSKDFEQIRYAHDTFLTKIQAQSFILNNLVSSCLNDIMESCLTFCSILTSVEDNMANKEFPNEKIENTIKLFQLQSSTLYQTFRSLEKRQFGSHLEQLLTRINFNNYMAEHNGLS